jgi:hypothetical protein
MPGNFDFTLARTADFSDGEPNRETIESAARACDLSGTGYEPEPGFFDGNAKDFEGNALRAADVSFKMRSFCSGSVVKAARANVLASAW